MHVQKFYVGSEIIPLTDWKMRTSFRHSLLVFKSAVVGTAHSGMGVFVITEAERRRHDARILAYRSRLLQGQAKAKTHDRPHANFTSWTKVQVWKALEALPCFSCAASESDVGPHHTEPVTECLQGVSRRSLFCVHA